MVQVPLGDIPYSLGHFEEQCKAGGTICNDSCTSFPILSDLQTYNRI